jgi:thiol-activated cytolysin
MNTIIDGSKEVVPANFTLEIEQIQSQEQLALEVGVKFRTWSVSGASNMQFSTDKQYNRFLVKLNQSYYTMSFDLPTSLDELFHESVTPQQLGQFAGPDNPPTFISSVTYGRIFYMLIESTSSTQEMNSKLNLSYSAFKNSAEGEVEVETFKSLKNLRIKVIAYGGDSKGSISMAGETTVESIVDRLEESTNIKAGSPISYVVRSVERPDQIVRTKLSTEYDVVNCELKGTLPPASFSSLVDLFKDDGNGGGIGAATQVSQSNIVLYNKAGTKYAWYNGNSGEVLGIFDITDENGPMGGCKLEQIGAALRFSDKRIYLFDSTGLKCQILDYNPDPFNGNSLPPNAIGTYRDNIYFVNEIFGDSENFQFIGQGFAGAVRYWKDYSISFFTYPIMHFFRNPGDKYADYRPIGNGVWQDPLDVNEWGSKGIVFEKIGAACRLEFASASNTLQLFFNSAGDEFQTWRPTIT